MTRRTPPLALFGASIIVAAANAASTAADNGGAGLWARGRCGGCHTLAAAGASANKGPNLDTLQPSVVAVAAQLANGGRGMPSFARTFSVSQIESLAVYVASVAGTRPAVPVRLAAVHTPAITAALSTPNVRRIQLRLRQLGFFSGPVTGYYGPLTAAAVRRFQSAAGLTADGVWGAATARALTSRGRTVSALAQPLTPPVVGTLPGDPSRVKQLQRELARLGFFHGPVSGFYGPLTTAAVKQFQASAGVTVDGRWGPASESALVRRLAATR
jgi:peptidoglycan hydrolase-like protein with peptidoglycan-binding domain